MIAGLEALFDLAWALFSKASQDSARLRSRELRDMMLFSNLDTPHYRMKRKKKRIYMDAIYQKNK